MKFFKIYMSLLLVLFGSMSCKDDFSVDLSDTRYVRLNKTSVTINPGEKLLLKATTDSLGSANKTFKWTVLDPSIASIESGDNLTAVVTGLKQGNSVIKVESVDGEIQYFTDLNVIGDSKVVKILAIGNSFSEDAIEHYLHELAEAGGYKVMIANLYFGGRSLETHWEKASTNGHDYSLRTIAPDGSRTTFNDVSIEQAVTGENWDYISFQEVSQLSGIIDGYKEYLPKLLAYVKPLASNPGVKYILHQTWAYAQDSGHFGFPNYDRDQMKMYNAIVDAVWQAKEFAGIDMVVPSGTAIQNGRTSYKGDKFTRDGYHLDLTLGRFTAASTWYEAIFGNVLDNPYYLENLLKYDVKLAKTAAAKAVENPKQVTELIDFAEPGPNEFVMKQPILIDFGKVPSGGVFNDFLHPGDLTLSNLKDTEGNNSAFVISVTQSFSGDLDRGLENVLGLPKTASQDMFFTDGIKINESALTLSNLNKNEKYTIALYGSINDNFTETKFHVIGENDHVGYLDNDNNLGKVVVAKDIIPASDATITIKMSPGPNNTQWAKFFGINAMIIAPEGTPIGLGNSEFVLKDPIMVDFGKMDPPAPFLKFDDFNNGKIIDMKDSKGVNTGVSMSVTSRFSGMNESGVISTTIGLPEAVCRDAFWCDDKRPESGVTLYNMNVNQTYQFIFFGSRRDASDNRETVYTVKGANEGSGAHNTSNNNSKVTIIKGIKPASDGSIDVRAKAGPNNNNSVKFYYMNTMIVAPDDYVLPGM
ncbi:MAG: DUF4886 domain-containing protein [Fermentimonas sp.]|jgi:hypothetical protein